MPLLIDLDTARAADLVEAIATGKPVRGVSSPDDLLALAGACLFALKTQSSLLLNRVDRSTLPAAHRAFDESSFLPDLQAAVEVCSRIAEALYDSPCAESLGPRIRAVVYLEGGRPACIPLEGRLSDVL